MQCDNYLLLPVIKMEVILVVDLNKLIKMTQNIQSKNMPSFLEFPGIKVLVARWADREIFKKWTFLLYPLYIMIIIIRSSTFNLSFIIRVYLNYFIRINTSKLIILVEIIFFYVSIFLLTIIVLAIPILCSFEIVRISLPV